jgi:sortase A
MPGTDAASPRRFRWLDRALIAFGLTSLVFCAVLAANAVLYQRWANAEVDRMIVRPRPDAASISRPASIAKGELIGRLEVPRLKLSAAIAEGEDDLTLGKAVGHLSDTPMPWQGGNVAFAAHRDTLFRPLKDIRINDEVRVMTSRGEFVYRVKRTQIVNPEDVWVLAPTENPSLTLITCYPFSFIGHAPQRFVVQAERVEPDVLGSALKGSIAR